MHDLESFGSAWPLASYPTYLIMSRTFVTELSQKELEMTPY